MERNIYNTYVAILKGELIKALGCTEPIAVAYAAARAREVLGQFPEKLESRCSGNIVKNVKGVTVPNSGGMRGIAAAVVLGAVGGDASRDLAVLETVTEADIAKTRELLAQKICTTKLIEGVDNLFIIVKATAGEHTAEVEIQNTHLNVTRIEKDGEVLFRKTETGGGEEKEPDKSLLNVRDILTFAETVNIDDIKAVLDEQIKCNMAISQEGLTNPYGAQVGRTLLEEYGTDRVEIRARAAAAAGSDARMSGCPMAVVINSGSGNQGMTASLPVIEYAKELKVSMETLYRALALSNLMAIHQKKYIGRLSAYCGVVSAACGAGTAICYMMGGGYEEICGTITNTIATIGGMVCDGAKSSCAAKIASAVSTAITGCQMAMKHRVFRPGEGLVKEDTEDTIASVGRMGRVGMKSTDIEILNIMLED
ncbi:MAG: L-serine ammonia-lyase, iron-sulfur-dependent, subunit alpha [Oscillospiraceae bacterium]|nr:L-serine ammonia-lyase, iron-sulfur-dependent, subunit alpha [Oscillospiraceae bacterium]